MICGDANCTGGDHAGCVEEPDSESCPLHVGCSLPCPGVAAVRAWQGRKVWFHTSSKPRRPFLVLDGDDPETPQRIEEGHPGCLLYTGEGLLIVQSQYRNRAKPPRRQRATWPWNSRRHGFAREGEG